MIFFFLTVVNRNGIVWRRSQASGGYKSVKAAPKKAPGRGPAAWSLALGTTTEIGAANVEKLHSDPLKWSDGPTGSSQLVSVSKYKHAYRYPVLYQKMKTSKVMEACVGITLVISVQLMETWHDSRPAFFKLITHNNMLWVLVIGTISKVQRLYPVVDSLFSKVNRSHTKGKHPATSPTICSVDVAWVCCWECGFWMV